MDTSTAITGTPQVGLYAQAVAYRTTGGALLAKQLTVTTAEQNRGLGPAQFKGVIDALPASLVGTWTISGRQIEVTEHTIVQIRKGVVTEMGAAVHVATAPPPRTDDEIALATLVAAKPVTLPAMTVGALATLHCVGHIAAALIAAAEQDGGGFDQQLVHAHTQGIEQGRMGPRQRRSQTAFVH